MKKPPTLEDVVSKQWKLPKTDKAALAVRTFSPTEKYIFFILVGLFVLSALSLLWKVNTSFLVTVPEKGGTLQEGIIGSPRFINPLLAISDADRDLTTLVYSGLLRATPDGKLVPDLAESYSISPDGLVYTLSMRADAKFHDGKPVTADDVIFTIEKAQDPMLKSPKRVNWDGVAARKIDDRTVEFTLKQPYAPFLENMTLGILPKHIWENIDADEFPFSNFNIEPIGSGPYKVKSLKRDSGGIPVYYHLKPFKDFTLGEPYISNIIIKFYNNEKDLLAARKDGAIESLHSIAPAEAETLAPESIRSVPLPRIFGIFFNQNQNPVFTDKIVRQAFDEALDKEAIVQTVLAGYGTPIDGPLPLSAGIHASSTEADALGTTTDRIAAARQALEDDGWKPNPDTGILEKTGDDAATLRFSISTSDTPELKQAAELVAATWRKVGADVEVLVFELGDLNQNVIRSRKYDALLFGQIIGRDLDLYPFWHSSQRNDPGLNVAQYANIKADRLLEEARAATEPAVRTEKYAEFAQEIRNDAPAIFLYSPNFIYAIPESVHNVKLGQIVFPSDRFLNSNEWYIETNKVWSVFAPANQ